MGWFFVFFFVSGFCSVLYEIVWLRLAMAQFGVTSALRVLYFPCSWRVWASVHGEWAPHTQVRKKSQDFRSASLRTDRTADWPLSDFRACPIAMGTTRAGAHSGFFLSGNYLVSGILVALTLIPWCACMGATIPLAMLAIRNRFHREASRSFSFLYLANVLGAVLGAVVPLLLIEIYGFRGTLRVGALLNSLLFIAAGLLSLARPGFTDDEKEDAASQASAANRASRSADVKPLVLLFFTGLTSMGAEVIWIRQFTPYLGTVVYAFAAILCIYLSATFIGSRIYRYKA